MLRKVLPLVALAFLALSVSGRAPALLSLPSPPGAADYRYGDEWAAYLAPEEECPGGEDVNAPAAEQRQTVLCLLNWARRKEGLPPLPTSRVLMRSAAMKAADIVRCDEFDHAPCGLPADAGARSLGYTGAVGENIAWGTHVARAPRPTVDGWLHSQGHRMNLLRPEWQVQGIALLHAARHQGSDRAAVWVSQFGD